MVVLLLAACGDGADPTPWTGPSVEPSGAARELTESNVPLPPGQYTRVGFEPRLTFELGAGWRPVQLLDGFFDVQVDETIGTPDVIAVQFATVMGVYGSDGATGTDGPDAAVQLVRGNAALEVLGSSESRIGGLAGAVVEVENTGTAHASVLEASPGPLGIDPARRLWIAFLPTERGRLLAVMVGGSAERWSEALEAAEPVLESVRIRP
ncbi:MAG TPA: hypothetical protein VF365_08120 [Candidatus Limnocylindria bacterium]